MTKIVCYNWSIRNN